MHVNCGHRDEVSPFFCLFIYMNAVGAASKAVKARGGQAGRLVVVGSSDLRPFSWCQSLYSQLDIRRRRSRQA